MQERDLVTLLAGAEMSRRQALAWLAAGVAAASSGCIKAPGDPILPYTEIPPGIVPGVAEHYATAMVLDGYATGLLGTVRDGRPIKLDGNPSHPASLGASSALQQASILDLYDPQRAKNVLHQGRPASFERLRPLLSEVRSGPLWIVLPPQSSATLSGLLDRVRERHPDVRVLFVHPQSPQGYHAAAAAYGRPLEQQLELSRAAVVVCLDADLLGAGPMSLRWAREFAAGRRPSAHAREMSRAYVAEPMLTPTGSLADHRLATRADQMLGLACVMALELRRAGRPIAELDWAPVQGLAARVSESARAWARRAASDALARPGESLVVAGERQSAAVHVVVHAINAALGNVGSTLHFNEATRLEPDSSAGLEDLLSALRAREVDAALFLDVNPLHTSGDSEELGKLLQRVPFSLHYSLHQNETSRHCAWMLPACHYLESWDDARAADGTRSILQPLVRPLYGAPSLLEVLALLAGDTTARASALPLVRAQWASAFADGFQRGFERALQIGLIEGSALPRLAPALKPARGVSDQLTRELSHPGPPGLELALRLSPTLHDGRFANNGWLQELPHPVTKQTWGNAALISPRTAARLGASDGTVLRLRAEGLRVVEVPALVSEHHADDSISLELGYGRRARAEAIAHGIGANGFALLASTSQLLQRGLLVEPTSRSERLARTQEHFDQYDRKLARHQTRDELSAGGHSGESTPPPTLFARPPAEGLQWAMTIDLGTCTGCSSCVIACQAENNVPVVGAADVRRGREMHWLRIDTYAAPGAPGNVVHQPMLCQHCEQAPCEYVCPVFATQHSPDGLNEMVYNRCVGTRFCSNNCPYKVRRFNWFHYSAKGETLALQRNPEVTVRERGVMEKCTYCVQRIRAAEIVARMERRELRPGEVVTACQQACPTGAIQFGALQHAESEMARWRLEPRAYSALEEVGTRPRTQYLAKIGNPGGEPS